jgi:hypothetical protein
MKKGNMKNINSRIRLLIALVAATTLTAYSGLAAPNSGLAEFRDAVLREPITTTTLSPIAN